MSEKITRAIEVTIEVCFKRFCGESCVFINHNGSKCMLLGGELHWKYSNGKYLYARCPECLASFPSEGAE